VNCQINQSKQSRHQHQPTRRLYVWKPANTESLQSS
jgi:hypothetical protein